MAEAIEVMVIEDRRTLLAIVGIQQQEEELSLDVTFATAGKFAVRAGSERRLF